VNFEERFPRAPMAPDEPEDEDVRFAPNMVFDFAAAYLVAGHALDIDGAEAKDVDKITGRFRITF